MLPASLLISPFPPSIGTVFSLLVASSTEWYLGAVGGGARHLAVHPDGKLVFVNEEAGSKITCFDWDAETGTLTPKQSLSTLPEGFAEQCFTAECSLNANGDVPSPDNARHRCIDITYIIIVHT